MNLLNDLHKVMASEEMPVRVDDRKTVVEVSAAMVIAAKLPLPSSPVESHRQYYTEQCSKLVESLTYKLNEAYPVNTTNVFNTVFHLHRARYDVLHPFSLVEAVKQYGNIVSCVQESLPPSHASVFGSPAVKSVAPYLVDLVEV